MGHSGHQEPISDTVVVEKAEKLGGGAKGDSSQWGHVQEGSGGLGERRMLLLLSHHYLLY